MKNNMVFQAVNLLVLSAALLFSSLSHAQGCAQGAIRVAPDSRYIDNGDGTITDPQVGLMWQQCSIGQSGEKCSVGTPVAFKWEEAIQQGDVVNNKGGLAGHTDWRVPKIKELRSLVESGCWSPSINIKHFPNTPEGEYWSSSSYTGFANNAWYTSFNSGNSQYNHRKMKYFIRLVRSAE